LRAFQVVSDGNCRHPLPLTRSILLDVCWGTVVSPSLSSAGPALRLCLLTRRHKLHSNLLSSACRLRGCNISDCARRLLTACWPHCGPPPFPSCSTEAHDARPRPRLIPRPRPRPRPHAAAPPLLNPRPRQNRVHARHPGVPSSQINRSGKLTDLLTCWSMRCC
jgi:hypothetical protein